MRRHLSAAAIRQALTGPSGSIRTPFHRDGRIDYPGLGQVIEANLAGGSRAALLTAGDSHYACLTDREIADVTRFTIRQVRGRAMVVAADRYYDTARAVAFARFLRQSGADLYMVMPPDWGKSVTPETLAAHYAAVARHLPVMLVTNVFVPRGIEFGLRTLRLCLREVPGIVAVKDDFCGAFGRQMTRLVHRRWAVWAGGLKANHYNIWRQGAHGYLSTMITFRPDVTQAYWAAIEAGDAAAARDIIRDKEDPWIKFISSLPGGFDAGIHGMLELFGIARRWRRPPYHSLSDRDLARLRRVLERLGIEP